MSRTWEARCSAGSTPLAVPTGKKFEAAQAQVADRPYTLEEAIPLVQKVRSYAKFDETVEMALQLWRRSEATPTRWSAASVVLPHGLGKTKPRPA